MNRYSASLAERRDEGNASPTRHAFRPKGRGPRWGFRSRLAGRSESSPKRAVTRYTRRARRPRPREAPPTRGVRLQQRELAGRGRAEPRHREPDETHRLSERDPIEQRASPTIDGEPVLRRVVGVSARQGREIGEAELERHAAARVALVA